MPALTLLAVLAAAPATVDHLDFDTGTVLTVLPKSYSTSLGEWSAWALADGDAEVGWASEAGAKGPWLFEYSFEDVQALTTVVADTVKTEEPSHPGCSVKAFELLVSPSEKGEDFKVLGTFEVPQKSVKSFPLPAKATARRVRVKVLSNWGDPTYTELMELDVLGPPSPRKSVRVAGLYTGPFNALRLEQVGDQVLGCYDYSQGLLFGTVEGRTARLTWSEVSGEQVSTGLALFNLLPTGKVVGVYTHAGSTALSSWDLEPSKKPPTCKAPSTLGATLARTRRVALYGIRFDAGLDVPRADAKPALEELLAALKATPGKATIEGHTDSTNGDDFNLALSQRRAAAVVAWLTQQGLEAGRLSAKGFGRMRPAADNVTAQGRALNRRVEVTLEVP
jgi:outer membrane protein OmpA-like peptidoglycan-associated protein